MRAIILATAILLAGCVSTGDRQLLQHKAPTAQFLFPGSIENAEACLTTALGAVADQGATGSMAVEDTATGRVIRITNMANPVVVVDLDKGVDGTRVTYRSRYRTGYGHITNAVLACRAP